MVDKFTKPPFWDGLISKINEIIDNFTNYLTTNTSQNITGVKTFIGQKMIEFKQSATADKLGFTCFNVSSTEIGAFEYRPNTISGGALFNINVPYSSSNYVGFRYWGTAVNVVAPKVATAGTYYIPTHITDGTNTVTATNAGVANISSLLTNMAKSDLSNVSSIDANSAVQTALDGKVNKSGDTMTGGLWDEEEFVVKKLSPDNITKGTTPSSTKYLGGIRWVDTTASDTNSTHRFANIECTIDSNGDTRLILQALKNEANSTDASSINIKYSQSGATSCTFPNTPCVDGQWIKTFVNLSTSTATGTTSMTNSLNSIIPNDGYCYELLLDIVGSTSSSSQVTITSSLANSAWNLWLSPSSSTGCTRLVVPVAADRVLNKKVETAAFNACEVYLVSYRRIGTNS